MAAGHDVRGSYDALAGAYATALLDELDGKPLDRALLDVLAEQCTGVLLDAGCGPGQIARYLRERGATVVGVDLSPAMIDQARRHHAGIEFVVGDLCRLPFPDGRFAGIAAFYAIVNFAPSELAAPLAELYRVLAPRGLALIAFHMCPAERASGGDERLHVDELWGVPIALDFWYLDRGHVEDRLRAAGFVIEARLEREPYPDGEHQSRRAYLLARKP
jgi:SAM-dependent methyltransferase